MPTAVRTTRRSRGRVGGSGAATLAPWGGAFIVEPMVDGGRECKRFVRLSLLRRVWLLRSQLRKILTKSWLANTTAEES